MDLAFLYSRFAGVGGSRKLIVSIFRLGYSSSCAEVFYFILYSSAVAVFPHILIFSILKMDFRASTWDFRGCVFSRRPVMVLAKQCFHTSSSHTILVFY